jgi:hypothetical protein
MDILSIDIKTKACNYMIYRLLNNLISKSAEREGSE